MIANILYQVCAKEIPTAMDAFAPLIICYAIATIVTLLCYFIYSGAGPGGLFDEYAKVNWAVIALGITAVGLEAGYVFCYKIGWEVSVAYVVQAAAMAAMLLLVGYIIYNEGISWNKIAGVGVCVAGLILINRE